MITDLPFRGNREYLHSTSILNFLLGSGGCCGIGLDLRINSSTNRQLIMSPVPARAGEKVIGRYLDESSRLYLLESDRVITRREPYEENRIVASCQVEDKAVTIPEVPGFTCVDRLVAGFKLLVEKLRPDHRGKLAFARIMWNVPPSGQLDIALRRSMAGQMYEGTMSGDGFNGTIIFGEWR